MPRDNVIDNINQTNTNVLFLSHAAVDEEIAAYLKQIIEESFPTVTVFVSTDPEDLRPGDPWVDTILEKLNVATLVIVLATARGLSRRWVWFESGAGWADKNKIVSCCIGSQRKGELPAPFCIYQALNIDEEKDCHALFGLLTSHNGKPSRLLNYKTIVDNVTRLDVRAEERWKSIQRDTFSPELELEIEKGLVKLTEDEKEALRLLLLYGNLTETQMMNKLIEKEHVELDQSGVFLLKSVARKTGFIEQILIHSERERNLLGKQGPWAVKASLQAVLGDYLSQK